MGNQKSTPIDPGFVPKRSKRDARGGGARAEDERPVGADADANAGRPQLQARWMSIEEQQTQIAEGVDRERRRVLLATVEDETRARSLQTQAIDRMVDKYLQNDMINSVFVPDFLERRIYANVVKLLMGVVNDTVETTSLEFMGHRLSFKIEPMPATDAATAAPSSNA